MKRLDDFKTPMKFYIPPRLEPRFGRDLGCRQGRDRVSCWQALPITEADLMDSKTHAPSTLPPHPSGKKWVFCDLCGTRMLDLHCKLKCQACGFVRDCSDP